MIEVNKVDMNRYINYMGKLCNAKAGKLLEEIEGIFKQNNIPLDGDVFLQVRKRVLDSFNDFRREAIRGLIR